MAERKAAGSMWSKVQVPPHQVLKTLAGAVGIYVGSACLLFGAVWLVTKSAVPPSQPLGFAVLVLVMGWAPLVNLGVGWWVGRRLGPWWGPAIGLLAVLMVPGLAAFQRPADLELLTWALASSPAACLGAYLGAWHAHWRTGRHSTADRRAS